MSGAALFGVLGLYGAASPLVFEICKLSSLSLNQALNCPTQSLDEFPARLTEFDAVLPLPLHLPLPLPLPLPPPLPSSSSSSSSCALFRRNSACYQWWLVVGMVVLRPPFATGMRVIADLLSQLCELVLCHNP